ncbi:MAG TPA: ATP-binding cassette domain-containing protein [Candidatus Dormibacteraeota bacterium]|nr:ATP-binding cassette domain-containing protein [Candidatus Dormibacteraeota bacterium]
MIRVRGRVVAAGEGACEAEVPRCALGASVTIEARGGTRGGIVTAVRDGRVRIAPLDGSDGIRAGDEVLVAEGEPCVELGVAALGRVVDARGAPLDGGASIRGPLLPLRAPAPGALAKAGAPPRACWTGVRAIDALATLARGQRIGIFGPAGAGKSTLLQSIVRHARVDAVVLALIGERGREVEGWLAALGEARPRATVVCATADEPAALRARAPLAAMAQAEYLRGHGLHVLLVMDSLARYCTALRELAAANGETTALRGYPPSAFAALGRLLERAGACGEGAVTAVCSVLVEGDDDREPVADAARALLDGHLILSRRIAERGRFPALDVRASCSRLFPTVASPEQRRQAAAVLAALAALEESSDLRAVGAYRPGGDHALDAAIAAEPALEAFLRQGEAPQPPPATLAGLAQLAAALCRIEIDEGVP